MKGFRLTKSSSSNLIRSIRSRRRNAEAASKATRQALGWGVAGADLCEQRAAFGGEAVEFGLRSSIRFVREDFLDIAQDGADLRDVSEEGDAELLSFHLEPDDDETTTFPVELDGQRDAPSGARGQRQRSDRAARFLARKVRFNADRDRNLAVDHAAQLQRDAGPAQTQIERSGPAERKRCPRRAKSGQPVEEARIAVVPHVVAAAANVLVPDDLLTQADGLLANGAVLPSTLNDDRGITVAAEPYFFRGLLRGDEQRRDRIRPPRRLVEPQYRGDREHGGPAAVARVGKEVEAHVFPVVDRLECFAQPPVAPDDLDDVGTLGRASAGPRDGVGWRHRSRFLCHITRQLRSGWSRARPEHARECPVGHVAVDPVSRVEDDELESPHAAQRQVDVEETVKPLLHGALVDPLSIRNHLEAHSAARSAPPIRARKRENSLPSSYVMRDGACVPRPLRNTLPSARRRRLSSAARSRRGRRSAFADQPASAVFHERSLSQTQFPGKSSSSVTPANSTGCSSRSSYASCAVSVPATSTANDTVHAARTPIR